MSMQSRRDMYVEFIQKCNENSNHTINGCHVKMGHIKLAMTLMITDKLSDLGTMIMGFELLKSQNINPDDIKMRRSGYQYDVTRRKALDILMAYMVLRGDKCANLSVLYNVKTNSDKDPKLDTILKVLGVSGNRSRLDSDKAYVAIVNDVILGLFYNETDMLAQSVSHIPSFIKDMKDVLSKASHTYINTGLALDVSNMTVDSYVRLYSK